MVLIRLTLASSTSRILDKHTHMNKFGQVLTPEEVAAVPVPSDPWIEPTAIEPVPTPEEMATWMPDQASEKRCWRIEVNVQTGEVTYTELSLEEYRARHVAKIVSRNEYVLRKQAETRQAARNAIMEALVDKIEADPTVLDRIK